MNIGNINDPEKTKADKEKKARVSCLRVMSKMKVKDLLLLCSLIELACPDNSNKEGVCFCRTAPGQSHITR